MISILIPTFKHHRYIQETIDSILNQSYKDIELIAVAVYGDNRTIDILKNIKDDRIKIIISNYACITHQWNLALLEASKESDYTMNFASDDIMNPGSLKAIYDFAIKHDADVAYPDFFRVNKNLQKRVRVRSRSHDHDKLLEGCYITDVSLIKKEVWDTHFPLLNKDKNHRIYRVWKAMSRDKKKLCHFANPTFLYRQHGNNVHSKKNASQKKFTFVSVGKNTKLQEFYKKIKHVSVNDIDKNHFVLYCPNPMKYIKHEEIFKYKKTVIHWDDSNINAIDLFVDKPNIYNITHDSNILEILKNKKVSNVDYINSESDLLDYLTEERYK
jgi:glycosyltransferase involved in cell wall biosynthesis